MNTTVAIVDDHRLVAVALSHLVSQLDGYSNVFEVFSGHDLIKKLSREEGPEIVLLDINMPIMSGLEVAKWLQQEHPAIKVIALSMNDSEETIYEMVRCGIRGYLVKGCSMTELKLALDSVVQTGVYYSTFLTSQLIKSINSKTSEDQKQISDLSIKEINFIKLACSELTYIEIADQLCVSPRTVDGYRESVFEKFNVKTRVGLVIEAIRLKIFQIK